MTDDVWTRIEKLMLQDNFPVPDHGMRYDQALEHLYRYMQALREKLTRAEISTRADN